MPLYVFYKIHKNEQFTIKGESPKNSYGASIGLPEKQIEFLGISLHGEEEPLETKGVGGLFLESMEKEQIRLN